MNIILAFNARFTGENQPRVHKRSVLIQTRSGFNGRVAHSPRLKNKVVNLTESLKVRD